MLQRFEAWNIAVLSHGVSACITVTMVKLFLVTDLLIWAVLHHLMEPHGVSPSQVLQVQLLMETALSWQLSVDLHN